MKRSVFCLSLCIFSLYSASGQDERFIRRHFDRKKVSLIPTQKQGRKRFVASTPYYKIDLDGDGWEEYIRYTKTDGPDWIKIYGRDQTVLLEKKMQAIGPHSRPYKIQFTQLGPDYNLLIIYFYEGVSKYLDLYGSIRTYFITVDRKAKKIKERWHFSAGPLIWAEREKFKRNYRQKLFEVNLIDFNNDGMKEVFFKNSRSQWVYFYKGKGQWISI